METNGIAKKIIILLCIAIIIIMAKTVIAAATTYESHNISSLYNQNYWCVERGAYLYTNNVNYRVSDSVTSDDPIFDYIISQGEDATRGTGTYRYRTPAQIALWIYLNDGSYPRVTWPSGTTGTQTAESFTTKGIILRRTTDISGVTRTKNNSTGRWEYNLGNTFITSGNPHDLVSARPEDNEISQALYNQGNAILTNADAYKAKLNAVPVISASVDSANKQVRLNVTKGTMDRFKVFINGNTQYGGRDSDGTYGFTTDSRDINIPFSSFTPNDQGRVSIKVVAVNTKYTVSFVKLTNSDKQRMIRTSISSGLSDCKDVTINITLPTDISLQKYITKVTNSDGTTVTYNNSTARENKYATTDLDDSTINRYHNSKNISINNAVSGTNNYKSAHPVPIEAGDTVEYTITVYNNSNVPTVVGINDRITVDGGAEITGITSSENGTISYSQYNTENGYTYYHICVNNSNTFSLAANASRTFKIYVKYNSYTNNILNNKVWIASTNLDNIPEYRTVDADYVQMNQYAVSLKKFVTKVNDTDIDGRNEGTNGNRYNENLRDGDKNKDPWKLDHKVPVEPGDSVIFTIRLKNKNNTPVKVTQISDIYTNNTNGLKLEYDSSYGIQGNGGGTLNTSTNVITFNNAELLQKKDDWVDVTIKFKVTVPTDLTNTSQALVNKAGIVQIKNINNIEVSDSDGTDNNYDQDWVQTKTYAVSLEKYVYSVNGINQNRDGLGTVYSKWEADKAGNQTITKDNDKTTWCGTKWRNPATANKGDIVTYEIIVKNDGNTAVNVNKIVDTIDKDNFVGDEKVMFSCEAYYNGSSTKIDNSTSPKCTIKWKDYSKGEILIENNVTIQPGENLKIYLTGTIETSNMSLDVINNRAKIISDSLINKNNVAVKDSTEYDNMDEDYIQMSDITISGTVWNDKASNKTSDNYNGLYDSSQENALDGIKVYLYRQGEKDPIATEPIATTTTSNGGKYSFSKDSLAENTSLENTTNGGNGKFIKAPMQYNHWGKIDDKGTNKLKALAEIVGVGESEISKTSKDTFKPNSDYRNYGTVSSDGYYSYYVVFEYDGITYTSTKFADVTSTNTLDSNAKEDGEKVKESRVEFNKRFSTINNGNCVKEIGTDNNYYKIEYDTKNENGYIPQSIHKYNEKIMAMQSSTNIINLSNYDNLVSKLQHVNLGLRGRDIFDLELTSDVYSTKVTVNKQEGAYNFNSNRVTVRKSDISVPEDAANFASEARNATVSEANQGIRKTDIYNDKYAVNGTKGDTGLGIEVTYKITITNASKTDGTATKITNYYDSKYDFVRAYSGASNLTTSVGDSGTGFKSVVIETPATNLSQGNSMEIYVVYSLKDASTTLRVLLGDGEKRLATYNMAEITEYTTQCASGQTEYTRGLLDKDSAPGSANKEQVRTTDTVDTNTKTTGGNPTTVQYYFGGNNLSKLKYEDDTYATPTLYFVTPGNNDDDGDGKPDDYSRIIKGTVFEDYTSINSNRVKSGNGIKDTAEPTIKGITVKLIEGSTVRDTTTTDEKGYYQFKDFLPGNYTIKYYYGDTEVTFLKTAPNEESYNGEDFQATNNSYEVSGINVHKLSTRDNFWYLDNESQGISTGTDDETRRNTVSSNVTAFTDDQMTKLNKIRDGEILNSTETEPLIDQTYMYANTNNMLFTVEKSEIDGSDNVVQRSKFGEYAIGNMNFGIAEAPITKIDLQKHVESFEIKDSTGNNTIASAVKNDSGKWELKGDVIAPEGTNTLDVSIEDEKLQGARLQITYAITSQIDVEKNFDGKELAYATITEIIDYIDNNLSYNNSLGRNSEYWEITERNSIFTDPNVQGTVDPEGLYTTIVKAKAGNPILNSSGGTATITLEKVLSSSDSTFEEIVTSSVDIYTYGNTVEITGISYGNTTPEDTDPTLGGTDPTPGSTDSSVPRPDLVRTPDRYIIIPKLQHDSTSSGIVALHPPTGDSSINIMYYVIATISLVILAVGTFGIRKFVVKKNKE